MPLGTPTVASSSRHPFELSWDPPVQQCYFPTSDLRFADPPSRRSAIPSATASQPPPTLRSTASKYSDLLPRRKQIEPGVWSDGTDRVLTAACPSVQTLLKSARCSMRLPPAPSEAVFALAALDVFYHIDDPAHWMFWSDEKKHETAAVVSRISLHRPQLIQSRVAWNGTSEYLFILSSLHGTSSLPIYSHKAWYPILNPSKVPSPPRVINLRKRKVAQTDVGEPSETAEVDDVERPRPKRAKSSGNSKSRQKSPSAASVDTTQTEVSEESPIGTSITSIEDGNETLGSTSATLLLLQDKNNKVENNTLATRGNGNTRNRKRRGGRPSSPRPNNNNYNDNNKNDNNENEIVQEPSSNTMSALLSPAVGTGSHSRNRSISQASSQTVVGRRSVSVLSAITAVEVLTPLGEEDDEESMKVDQVGSDCEESKEELGMVTRGRANKSRAMVQSKEDGGRAGKRAKRKGGVK